MTGHGRFVADRDGFVLLYSLTLVLAAALLSIAVLTVGARERLIAGRLTQLVRARSIAAAEVVEQFTSWSAPGFEGLVPGQDSVVVSARPHTAVRVTRLGPTSYLLSATTELPAADGPPTTARVGLLLFTVDGRELLAAFPAAVSADSVVRAAEGSVSGFGGCGSPGSAAGARAPAIPPGGATVVGAPPTIEAAPPLPPDSLRSLLGAMADVAQSGGGISPHPRAEGGRCLAGPANWGSVDAGHPCHDHLPVIRFDGSVGVGGGEGRGVLVVEGDLSLEGPFTFEGVILVGGTASIGPGVALRGAVRARTVEIEGGDVRFDRCAIQAAVSGPAFQRAYRGRTRWWVPQF